MAPTYLVTGSAGFIGSRLVHHLLGQGATVVGVDSFTDSYDPGEKLARATALSREPGYRHVSDDVADIRDLAHFDGVDVVFHLAGRPGVRDSFKLLDRYLHDNVEATTNLLDLASRAPSVRRLVYASSSSVYGNAALPFREDGPTEPISPYGETKLEAEHLCLAESGDDLETVALRYFTVYGPGQRPDMGLRRFGEAALEGRDIQLYGDGTQSRDFTYVDDIVRATQLAATAPVAGLAVNVGGGERVTLVEVLEILSGIVGRPLAVDHQPFARGDARHTGADLSRARELLGFVAAVPFRDGYAAEVDWLRTSRAAGRRTA